MKAKRIIYVVICVFVLTSCATLGIRTAKDAFEEGMASFNKGEYEEAVTFFKEATELNPTYGEAYLYLGRSYLNLGRWTEAIQPLRTALRLAPEKTRGEVLNLLVDALFGGGIEALKKGDFKSSVGHFKEVIELHPGYEKANIELFRALMGFGTQSLSEGNLEEAVNAFSEAVQLSPSSLNAYLLLAKAFFENGDLMKSIQTVQELLSMDPGNRDAQSLMRQLMTQ